MPGPMRLQLTEAEVLVVGFSVPARRCLLRSVTKWCNGSVATHEVIAYRRSATPLPTCSGPTLSPLTGVDSVWGPVDVALGFLSRQP